MAWWQIVLVILLACFAVTMAVGRRKLGRYQSAAGSRLEGEGVWASGEDPGLAERWPGAPFDRGRDPEVTDVRSGDYRGHEVCTFTCSVVEDAGRAHPRVSYAVQAVTLPHRLPALDVRRHDIPGAGAVRAVLRRDAPSTGDHRFDKTFAVDAADQHYVEVVLDERVRARMIEDRLASYRICGNTLLLWSDAGDSRWREYHLDAAVDIAEGLPADAWRMYGQDSDPVDNADE